MNYPRYEISVPKNCYLPTLEIVLGVGWWKSLSEISGGSDGEQEPEGMPPRYVYIHMSNKKDSETFVLIPRSKLSFHTDQG